MWKERSQLLGRFICGLAAVVTSLIVLPDILHLGLAQRGRPSGPVDMKREQRDREIREAKLRTAELGVAGAKIDQKRVEAAIAQVKQDFRQIQIVRNEMVRNLLAERPLDYKLISTETGEINKRADRLKTFLMAPIPEDKEKSYRNQVEFDSEEMKEALVRLCNLIAGFVDNPVLKTPDKVDVEQSAKAGGDLLSIIALSGNIKRSADKLNKVSR